MMQVTLRIASITFCSQDVAAAEADRFGGATADIVRQFMFHMTFPVPRPELLPTPGNLKYWRALGVLDSEAHRIIGERRQMKEMPHDLLSLLMGAIDPDTGKGLTDEELRDELVTLLAAGHETTANALAWALHLLAANPASLSRLQAELSQVLGGRAPTGADVAQLPFTGRVLSESLRLYPPAWVHARKAAQDDEMGGHVVPAGTMVVLPQWAVHRDSRLWSNPLDFDPDRFLSERSQGRHKFAYFPFSGGQRKCIGDRFAQMEAVLVLATLLQRFTPVAAPGKAVVPEPGVTLRPRGGIWQTIHASAPVPRPTS